MISNKLEFYFPHKEVFILIIIPLLKTFDFLIFNISIYSVETKLIVLACLIPPSYVEIHFTFIVHFTYIC